MNDSTCKRAAHDDNDRQKEIERTSNSHIESMAQFTYIASMDVILTKIDVHQCLVFDNEASQTINRQHEVTPSRFLSSVYFEANSISLVPLES
jgi:hypothetical protein